MVYQQPILGTLGMRQEYTLDGMSVHCRVPGKLTFTHSFLGLIQSRLFTCLQRLLKSMFEISTYFISLSISLTWNSGLLSWHIIRALSSSLLSWLSLSVPAYSSNISSIATMAFSSLDIAERERERDWLAETFFSNNNFCPNTLSHFQTWVHLQLLFWHCWWRENP